MLKVAVVILVVMLAYAGIYSLMSIIAPKVMMESSLKAVAGKTVDDAQDDGYLRYLVVNHINAGLFALTTTIAGFFVLFAGFQKAQKWAWWSFLVVAGIAWLGGLVITITTGDNLNMILRLIGAVIFLVGLLIPIKAFFGGKAKEEAKETEEA